jgi:methyltransferase (TIGR00027 family)
VQLGKPSRTAWAAAAHRAAHQVLENGRLFADPHALRILGKEAEAAVQKAVAQPSSQKMRIFVAARTRFAEDALAAAVERGVQQLVILGAGLDTYVYRNAMPDRLHVFEVDHPATQAWKRQRLADADISIPDSLTFAPIDFEHQTLGSGLTAVGFDASHQTFFTWLGVVPYLTHEAIWSTLAYISSLPNGAHVVFDYGNPPASLPEDVRSEHANRAERVAQLGEAWITYFDTGELQTKLMRLGFSEIEDIGPAPKSRPAIFRAEPVLSRIKAGTSCELPPIGLDLKSKNNE